MTRALTAFCVVLALALALAWPSPARADDVPVGQVTIISVTPSQLDVDDSDQLVQLTGQFTNSTGRELFWATAELWHYSGAISSADALVRAVDAPEDAPLGVRHEGGTVLTEQHPLAPGATVQFSLEAPLKALQATKDELATIVGVHIRAATSKDGTRVTVGRTRVLIPHNKSPLEAVDVTLLTASPDIATGKDTVSEALTTAIEGQLSATLEQATYDDTKVLIDPLLYEAAQRLAEAKTPNTAAVSFLAKINNLRAAGRLWRLPPGNPALARLPMQLRDNVASWSDALVPEELADVPLVALVKDQQLAGEGFDKVVIVGTGGNGEHRFFSVEQQAGPTLLTDLPSPVSSVLMPGEGTWEQVDAQLAVTESRTPLRLELTTGDDTLGLDLRGTQLAAYSSNFATEDDALEYLLAIPEVTFDPTKVTIQASPSFVMGQRESEFPMTITNRTDLPIWVRVSFISENPLRISVPDTDVIRVGPGEALTLRVTPAAKANGATRVHARLETADGSEVGATVDIEITATEFGRVGWIIIMISGAVVLGGTILRIRAVQKERAKEISESGQ